MDVGLSLGSNPFKLNNCKTSLIGTQVSLSVEVGWYHLLGKVAVRKERKLAMYAPNSVGHIQWSWC